VPRAAPKKPTLDQALKRLARLEAKLPDDRAKTELQRIIEQLQAAISASQSDRQALADRVSQHESALTELHARVAELGEANANQARLISALTQPTPGAATGAAPGVGEIPIVIPTGGIRPSIIPTVTVNPSATPGPGAPAATPAAIAGAFQQAFSAIQGATVPGGPSIKSMDVQVKGFVQVSEDGSQTTMSFPTPDAVPPTDVLSTVSMSLGAVPELKPPNPSSG
jgi:hypothetical protein